MKIELIDLKNDVGADIIFYGIYEDKKLASRKNNDALSQINPLIQKKIIKLKNAAVTVLPTVNTSSHKMVGVVGLGENLDAEQARLVGGAIVLEAKKYGAKQIVVDLAEINAEQNSASVLRGMCEGLWLGNYSFKEYKSKNVDDIDEIIEKVFLIVSDAKLRSSFKNELRDYQKITEAVCFTRNLINRPASSIYPKILKNEAENIAANSEGLISVSAYGRAEIKKMGANAILAVASGSEHEPYLIHLEYKPKKCKNTIAIVGKGVTFDSGGLSLKPAEAMEDMKSDMAGAAAVLGVFSTLTKLKPNVCIHGVIPCVENMLSDRSMRVGDIIKTLSGKTVEVMNTDAEGRLILADALTYAEQQKPSAIVDLATLTGACIIALGEQYSGAMGDSNLINELKTASESTGERIWELPLPKEYEEKMKSEVADLSNIHKGRAGGAIMGGLFLKEFVTKTPWAHLDIAGPSYNRTPLNSYTPSGASGVGVRLIVAWIRGLES